MGDLAVNFIRKAEQQSNFMQQLLNDIQALDILLSDHRFDNAIQRIGAEQELTLTDQQGQPVNIGPELLKYINDERVTTEIGQFNLEINLDPYPVGASCLSKMEQQLDESLQLVRSKAAEKGARVFLGGILPTFHTSHLGFDSITPEPRYIALSERLREMRGRDFEIHLNGADELMTKLDSVLFEACNTSFQLHLQIPSHKFVDQYNWAQWMAAPIMGMVANSPFLLQKELWMETRIALFQQSIDTRTPHNTLRHRQPRVSFGHGWLRDSAAEIFKEQVARFPLLITKQIEENAFEAIEAGRTPRLKALLTHNGTVYGWNRACYGISDNGCPHLRIEARYLPSGPSAIDEMANFAFWLGLQNAGNLTDTNITERIAFRDARSNFYEAAKSGLHAHLNWHGKRVKLTDLVTNELIPMAESGLQAFGIDPKSISKYLSIIQARASMQVNGASWQVHNYSQLLERWSPSVATQVLTQNILDIQQDNIPVHEWPNLSCPTTIPVNINQDKVSQWMTTDLFAVEENDPLAMVKAIMNWKKIRHIPVENAKGELVGLITKKNWQAISQKEVNWSELSASSIMVKDLITAEEGTGIDEVIDLMKGHQIGCLPIVFEKQLVGLITDTDIKRLLRQ